MNSSKSLNHRSRKKTPPTPQLSFDSTRAANILIAIRSTLSTMSTQMCPSYKVTTMGSTNMKV